MEDVQGPRAVPHRGRTPEARAFRAERVVEVAFQLATEGGYEAVQMREVARRADVALATLYRYFPSKSDLIEAATAVQLEALREDLLARPSRGRSAAAHAVAVFIRAFRAMAGNPGWAHAAATANYSLPAFGAEKSQLVRVDDDFLIELAAAHAWGPDHVPTTDQQFALRTLQSLWGGCLLDWLNGRMTAEQVEQELRHVAERLVPGATHRASAVDRTG